MLKGLEDFLSKLLDDDVALVKKGSYKITSQKRYLPVNKNYILSYHKQIDHKLLFYVKRFLKEFLKRYEKLEEQLRNCSILNKEIDAILRSNELFYAKDHRDFQNLFLFLDEEQIEYVLIENQKIVLQRGLDSFTIEVYQRKLKNQEEISLLYKNGEIVAFRIGFYTIILKSAEKKIEPFYKRVIKSRLFWLNALYEAKKLYEIDRLSGLYTRAKFLKDMEHFQKEQFLFINIRNFKLINELYSTLIGDRLLKEIAQKLQSTFKKRAYRIYGDRFVLACRSDIESVQKRLEQIFNKEFLIYNPLTKEYNWIKVEIQIVYFRKKVENILEKANLAFKKMKGDFSEFEKDIEPLLIEEKKTLHLLTEAIDSYGVEPFFQRVVKKESADTIYFEALMRIVSQEEIILPGRFLDLAKEKGYYTKLNAIMIQKSIEAAKRLSLKVSINIDVYDILQDNFLDRIQNIIQETRVDPQMVQFEILEEEDFYRHIEKVKRFIDGVKELGCCVALDDFGKGYSNFSTLIDLDIDLLKIDMGIVRKIIEDEKSFTVLKTVVQFAQNLNLAITAEGVGSKEIYEKLQKLPIDFLQGFYYDKPKSLEDLKSTKKARKAIKEAYKKRYSP